MSKNCIVGSIYNLKYFSYFLSFLSFFSPVCHLLLYLIQCKKNKRKKKKKGKQQLSAWNILLRLKPPHFRWCPRKINLIIISNIKTICFGITKLWVKLKKDFKINILGNQNNSTPYICMWWLQWDAANALQYQGINECMLKSFESLQIQFTVLFYSFKLSSKRKKMFIKIWLIKSHYV